MRVPAAVSVATWPRPASQDAAIIGRVTSPAVHRLADPPVPVEVDDVGGSWPGQVLAWRGERVYVRYSEGPGLTHLTWVSAARVRRV